MTLPFQKFAATDSDKTDKTVARCKSLFQQQACATHPSAGGTLQELLRCIGTTTLVIHMLKKIYDQLSASEISFAEVQLDAEDFQRYVQWICHSWPAAVAARGRVQTLPQTNESPC